MPIERLTEEDALELSGIENQLFEENAFGPMLLKAELVAGRGYCLREEDNIVAYALVRESGGVSDLTRLGVLPHCRGRGLGTQLLREVIANATHPLILTVREGNRRARKLYESEGFSRVGWIPTVRSIVLMREG
jgi:[ribosomal protein S18]-alanine N-acetyltransferase